MSRKSLKIKVICKDCEGVHYESDRLHVPITDAEQIPGMKSLSVSACPLTRYGKACLGRRYTYAEDN